ncbi:hypothetical protein [Clavibacter michiganensis]|uniref:hypothetical protein n=1 Tax=Clavibacter michiganensis TaxID=28447 RepID=UPI00142FC182|nr:hypothetical protein [Clavibacter michiganensis]QIT13026.1 hypothetical protein GRD74_15690 [Clavibacter michiganensis subsp. michiganensis]QIT16158.1 hypothetical protein GRD61_15720 [Clavibacter michiganensis subsp. michiganensis]
MANAAGDVACQMIAGCEGTRALVGAGVEAAVSDGFQQAADAIYSAYDDIMKQFLTSWVNSGFVVSLDNKATAWFQSSSLPITIALLTLGLVVAGARVMYSHRGEPFQEVMQALGRAVAVISFGTAAIQILVWGGDAYATWILNVSGTSASAGLVDAQFASTFPGLALIFGLLGVLAVGVQWVIMFVRQALLLLLNAFWQMSAAYATLRQGVQAFEKVTAWIIAFIIYTPLAASIYAFAWRLKDGQDGIGGVLYGLMLILLAVVALPALMRLLVPGTSALGNAIGGAVALGVAATVLQAGVAVGAAVATGGAAAGAGAAGAGAGVGAGAAAEGGEIAASGETGVGVSDASSVAGGGDSAPSGGAGDVVSGGSGSDAGNSGSTASGASGSGQSAGSRAGWAAAGTAADRSDDDGDTADGVIGE